MASNTQTDLASLVRGHQGALWRYLRLLGSPPDEAEDLVQEVFLVLLQRPGFAAVSAAATRTFLRRTARHLFLQRRRAGARSPLTLRADLVDAVCDDPADPLADRWVPALRRCLERLEGRRRDVVRLFYHDGMGRAEVAAALGMRETGVKTLLQRTRAALRECMERIEGGNP